MAAGNSGDDKKKALKAAQRGGGVKQAAAASEPEPLSGAALAIDKASRNVGESLSMQRARHMIEGAFSDEDKIAGLAKVVRHMMYNDSNNK